jgi:hypothetical protein
MIRICAWCKADMGTKEPLDDTSVSHGICVECANEFRAFLKVEKFVEDLRTSPNENSDNRP